MDPLAFLNEGFDPERDVDPPAAEAMRRSPAAARRLREEALLLHGALRALVEDRAAGRMPDALALHAVNRVLASGDASGRLEVDEEGWRLVERVSAADAVGALAPLGRVACAWLAEAPPERLRRCGSRSCEHWFVDTSRGGRRKWCSMAVCGNREKARRHRRRHEGG